MKRKVPGGRSKQRTPSSFAAWKSVQSRLGHDPMREALGPGTQFVGVRGGILETVAGRQMGCL